jgi:DNA-binding NtrC family response regulator
MPKKLLLVEDDVLIGRSIALDLEDNSLDVIGVATHYDQALSLIRQDKPDIVLTDINLKSSKDGIDIAMWVNNYDQDISIIFVTGYNNKLVKDKLTKVKYLSIIEKPIDVQDILNVLS